MLGSLILVGVLLFIVGGMIIVGKWMDKNE